MQPKKSEGKSFRRNKSGSFRSYSRSTLLQTSWILYNFRVRRIIQLRDHKLHDQQPLNEVSKCVLAHSYK